MVEIDLVWLAGFVGVTGLALYAAFKYRLKQTRNVLKELFEAVAAVDDAVADDKVTEEEFRLIYAEFQGVIAAIKAFFIPQPPA